MRTGSFSGIICTIFIFIVGLSSCSKELSRSGPAASSGPGNRSSVIGISVDSAGTDSIYILQTCSPGYFRDSIASSNLPSAILTFLDSNYSGFNGLRAYIIQDSAGTTGGYVVIINYNNKPVALLFDGSAHFEQVLEQRQSGDLSGAGWHNGGRFQDRNGLQQDSIALGSIPFSILSYMSGNYPQDTLIRAYINIDSSYLLISESNGIFLTVFNSEGLIVKRVALSIPGAIVQSLSQNSLPAAALSYLNNSYPNFVFEEGFSLTLNNIVQGYEVILDANNTKYVVLFDASGNFETAGVIW
jgi:hypothetical protein